MLSMKQTKQQWETGNIFLVELKDGKFVLGQIVGREADVLNNVSCAFFDIRVSNLNDLERTQDLPVSKIFSILFVTREFLDSGKWKIAGSRHVSVEKRLFHYEVLREKGFVGAKVIGSGIVIEFLNAFYGLHPWDDWKDPNYLDKLLLSNDKKPATLVFKNG